MRGQIDRHWNQISQKVTLRKTVLNWASYFMGKLLPIGHVQWVYSNGVVHERKRMVYYKGNRLF